MSAHQMGLSELLSVAKLHGKVPDKIVLISVPPQKMDMHVGLTDEVQKLVPEVVETGLKIINEWLGK